MLFTNCLVLTPCVFLLTLHQQSMLQGTWSIIFPPSPPSFGRYFFTLQMPYFPSSLPPHSVMQWTWRSDCNQSERRPNRGTVTPPLPPPTITTTASQPNAAVSRQTDFPLFAVPTVPSPSGVGGAAPMPLPWQPETLAYRTGSVMDTLRRQSMLFLRLYSLVTWQSCDHFASSCNHLCPVLSCMWSCT